MNLVKTLARVAIGAMVARGVGKMIGGRSGAGAGAQGELPGGMSQAGSGLGGLLGGLTGGSSSGGGLGGLLGGLTGAGGQSGGGLGGLLGGLSGAGAAGGLAGMLGGLLGGQAGGQTGGQANSSASAGGLGGLLDSLNGAPKDGLGGMLNQSFGNPDAPQPTPDQNQHAELMLRAMINAAKSDGQVDDEEREKIVEHLNDVTREEAEFVHAEMAAPLDVEGFVGSVPQGMEQQIYLMSLLAIKLDSQVEAQYLDRIAKGMNLAPADVNDIHAKLGLPKLYA